MAAPPAEVSRAWGLIWGLKASLLDIRKQTTGYVTYLADGAPKLII